MSRHTTEGGVKISYDKQELVYKSATEKLISDLNSQQGVFLSSSFEYPNRYTRWDLGFVNPPIKIIGNGRYLEVISLNERGIILLQPIHEILKTSSDINSLVHSKKIISLNVNEPSEDFIEEQRSKQPTVFSVLRLILALFKNKSEDYLGLYGAFGYELCFQFESIKHFHNRENKTRDLVLYIPDEIIVVDHHSEKAFNYSYDFEYQDKSTTGLKRHGSTNPFILPDKNFDKVISDHNEGEYSDGVRKALKEFASGNLFEVVPGQVFSQPCYDSPSEIFKRLKKENPAPYGALMNLGEQEYLVSASPEMYVRVKEKIIETCPISGTIKRGTEPIDDAKQILTLLNSEKEASELTMCTDVDRNDKSRVCHPESIRLLGRRQIEMYSRLIHTVDHVEGKLREEFDALDGFLSHTWAVTVTGAPKKAAIQFIEYNEKSPRVWYGGAIGSFTFNGNINTGLTLRTMHIQNGVANIHAGATLLYDSEPDAEELETRLKASALIDIINPNSNTNNKHSEFSKNDSFNHLTILMVDHQDSFVHTLSGYLKMTGAKVVTMRPDIARKYLKDNTPDLLFLSPGPRDPKSFNINDTINIALTKKIPIFGVCLGLQGIVEYFGGALKKLGYPMHGKPSLIESNQLGFLKGLPKTFTAGRYHSLYADIIPSELKTLAKTEDGTVMAIQHENLPIAAVQFHPESIMSAGDNIGFKLIKNMLLELTDKSVFKHPTSC